MMTRPTPHAQLIEAIENGDVATVRALLAESPTLSKQLDEYGFTPLLRAVSSMNRAPELVEAILSAGADARFCSDEGYTALHLLADVNGGSGTGEIPGRIARLLVAAGADIEARQHWGWTPLMRAAVEGTPDELQALVDVGANVNSLFPDHTMPEFLRGRTTLMATLGDPAKTRILIAAGADPLAKDAHGQTALEYAQDCLAEAARNPVDVQQLNDELLCETRASMLTEMEAAGINLDEPIDSSGVTPRQTLEQSLREAFGGISSYDYAASVRESLAIIRQAVAAL
jgi:hypothetical protein